MTSGVQYHEFQSPLYSVLIKGSNRCEDFDSLKKELRGNLKVSL
jgi:hypothetical protein